MLISIPRTEKRTPQQIRHQYKIEKELANILKNSSKNERKYLYTFVYDELIKRVPHHPKLKRRNSKLRYVAINRQIKLLKHFLYPDVKFLELGPGDCSLSLEITKHVNKVYAVDVSWKSVKNESFPENFERIISDGSSISVPENSIEICYSNQVMEHVHPEDAFEQLKNIYKALRPGGIYICITPNRLSGPHDISKYFDTIATGFHLKEYTATELCELFNKVGFSKILAFINTKGIYIKFPIIYIKLLENYLKITPFLIKKVFKMPLFRILLGVQIIAVK